MLFAEISDAVWLGILGLMTMIVKEFFDQRRVAAVHKEVVATKESLGTVKDDMHKLEENTNSKMDKLLEATGKASKAEGELKGRADERAEAITGIPVLPVPAAPGSTIGSDMAKVKDDVAIVKSDVAIVKKVVQEGQP